MDWLDTLQELRVLKLELARLDPRAGMPIMPATPATEMQVENLERRLGHRVPESYRSFLLHHDGWPQVFQGVNLLGVGPLARGAYVDLARMILEECETPSPCGRLRRLANPSARLVPFGIDPQAESIFAWDLSISRPDGEAEVVVWMNEVGLRLGSFVELLELLRDIVAADLDAKVEARFSSGDVFANANNANADGRAARGGEAPFHTHGVRRIALDRLEGRECARATACTAADRLAVEGAFLEGRRTTADMMY